MAHPRPFHAACLAMGLLVALVAVGLPFPAAAQDEEPADQVPSAAADDLESDGRSSGGTNVVALPSQGSATSSWDGQAGGSGVAQSVGGPAPGRETSPVVAGDARRIHLKLRDDAGALWRDGGFEPGTAPALEEALASETGVEVRLLFERSKRQLDAERAEAEAVSGERQPDLSSWYLVTVPSAAAGERLIEALEGVRSAEVIEPEPFLAPTAPAEEERQGYLDPSPAGIGAEWAWGRAGGTGAGVTIVVVDSGFDTNHSDLDAASAAGVAIAHEPAWEPHHGLQVLGILAGDDDGQGIRGIATGAGLRTVNSGRTSGQVANAINLASAAAGAGDVITISQGICAVDGCSNGIVLPLVYSRSARDALRVASGRGVITVVSAGNGGANLDGYSGRIGDDSPETIVVGGGNPSPPSGCTAADGRARSRVASSNYGARVDLQGWGVCVRTAEVGGGYKWWGFTSAATPIVAGAAALLSSMAERRLGINLTGSQARSLLSATGRPQAFGGARGGNIGPLPDVRSAVASLSRLPENDMWASAAPIGTLPFRTEIDTQWAGVQVDEPTVTCGAISHTTWYRITPERDIEVDIHTLGSDHDTMIGLWQRDGNALTQVGCADDIGPNNPRSRLSRRLEAGATYYVQVGGAGAAVGKARLTVEEARLARPGCDVDGDQFGDVVSGSPHEDVKDARDAGRALVHLGKRNGKPKRVINITQERAGLSGASEAGDLLGAAVACGDFDADGYDDLAIGSPGEGVSGDDDAGTVRVIQGAPKGLSTSGSLTISQASRGVSSRVEAGDFFGAAVAVADFDGDGFDDLAIGAPGEDIGRLADAGLVHLLHGSPDGLVVGGARRFNGDAKGLPNSAEPGDLFGQTLAAGDVDGDGYGDLIIGSPGEDIGKAVDAGAAFVLYGSRQGLRTRGSAVLHQASPGVAGTVGSGDAFADAVAIGDLNGDGYADLAVGVPGERVADASDAGLVHVFPGSSQGLSGQTSVDLHQDTDGVRGQAERRDAFGAALAIGDVNGDAMADLVVGAPGEDVRSVNAAGLVHLFLGGADGVRVAGNQVVSQASRGVSGAPERGDRFGSAVATVDINGDGRRDVVVGVPQEDAGKKKNTGYMLLVPGGADGLLAQASSGLSQKSPRSGGNETGDRFGYSIAASAS